jgi:hypothetical protein
MLLGRKVNVILLRVKTYIPWCMDSGRRVPSGCELCSESYGRWCVECIRPGLAGFEEHAKLRSLGRSEIPLAPEAVPQVPPRLR